MLCCCLRAHAPSLPPSLSPSDLSLIYGIVTLHVVNELCSYEVPHQVIKTPYLHTYVYIQINKVIYFCGTREDHKRLSLVLNTRLMPLPGQVVPPTHAIG